MWHRSIVPAVFVAIVAMCRASGATDVRADLTGDDILARAASAPGLSAYSVPVHFDVHMLRPVGVKAGVEGIANYRAPATGELVITKAPAVIGGFFKGTYPLDMAPQTWPAKYTVSSFASGLLGEEPVYVLQAAPKAGSSDISRVVFTITQADFSPKKAQWFYRDGSTIAFTIVNRAVGKYTLPQSESISVAMPKYALDAVGKYGDYRLTMSPSP